MKNLLFSFLGILLLLTACKKDDDCNAGSLDTNIIGEWSVNVLGTNTGDVRFNANGTLDDEDDALISGESGGVVFDQKTYTVTGNTVINLKASNGTDFVEYDMDVVSYTCDEIIVDVFGIEGSLNRK